MAVLEFNGGENGETMEAQGARVLKCKETTEKHRLHPACVVSPVSQEDSEVRSVSKLWVN